MQGLYLNTCELTTGVGGFLPAVKQIANVASLPGIVGVSIRLLLIRVDPEEDGTSTCSRAYYVNKVCVVCN